MPPAVPAVNGAAAASAPTKLPESSPPKFHTDIFLDHWRTLAALLSDGTDPTNLEGTQLSLAQVIAISRYQSRTQISSAAYDSLGSSRRALDTRLANGEIIYGVNTGFGGTADVRTKQTQALQRVLIRELHYGILGPDVGRKDQPATGKSRSAYDLENENYQEAPHIPLTWTRAAILVRINSLIRGASGVRAIVVERMQDLLSHNIIPMIPLRGSISASGDLSPLSYIGGAIQGKPTIRTISSKPDTSAQLAFADAGLTPVTLESKEGLALVNGTAISAAAGALALHDAHGLAVLAQFLTAMSVEALTGTDESFHPFFSESRPHPGQIESARNILWLLQGSQFVKHNDGTEASLRQDRYSIRTAPQWIGPVLEDFALSHQQMSIECNSATDNPLVSPEGEFLHGGNFQARSVTSALEKVRQGLQAIGRMLFTQCTEMINPATSRGLPPNLVAEDPSSSYIFKGTDLNIAALQAELGFLSAPMNHVQTAEMGNQSLNSLAFIAARYTHLAVEVLSQMAAAHLVALCQALDLRAMHLQFLDSYQAEFHRTAGEVLTDQGVAPGQLPEKLWLQLPKLFDQTVSMDASDRFPHIGRALRSAFFDEPEIQIAANGFQAIDAVSKALAASLEEQWRAHRDAYLEHGDASRFLGRASKALYSFVRHDLEIPMLHTSKIKTPAGEAGLVGDDGAAFPSTVGSFYSKAYRAVKDGTLACVAAQTLDERR